MEKELMTTKETKTLAPAQQRLLAAGLRWVSNGRKEKAQDIRRAVCTIFGIAEPPPCLECRGETPVVSGMGWELAAAMERGGLFQAALL
jgi:hypothetical protein